MRRKAPYPPPSYHIFVKLPLWGKSDPQAWADVSQPGLGALIIPGVLTHDGPELRRMVPLAQMRQLVDDHILEDRRRSHDQPVVEAERATRPAAAPFRA